MRALNLGILAHIDAGKTSLTERLLYQAGVIDEIGSVDKGSTQTDSLQLERQRGITIKSAVVSFTLLDTVVNLIDTPGHPDFIAEVERVLSVLDGVVLVVSAVEGVQAQTLVLMRALRRLRIPTLIFVNKVDRRGARCGEVIRIISERLSPSIVVMGAADHAAGTKEAEVTRFTGDDEGFVKDLADTLARHDDALLADFLDDERLLSYERLRSALAVATRQARVYPVYLGSAVTGTGIDALTEGIRELLPAAPARADADLSAGVFKVERGSAGEKISYVRVFEGAIRVRDRLAARGDKESKVTAVGVFDSGEVVRRDSVEAGRIAKIWGLTDVRIGDTLGARPGWAVERQFSPPSLETAVVPDRPADRGSLYVALTQLAEQDPLIGLRHDALRNEFYLSLYGEVQKEVVEATLLDEYGLRASFQETSVICVERPVGTGDAFEIKNKGVNPFLATVGIRIDPAPVSSGVAYRLEVELGSMPYAFMKAVEDTARETLRQGLCGWEVTDCTLTLTHSGYNPRQSHSHATFDKTMSSTGADFRGLTPLVVMDALRKAGTRVHEPIHRFHLEIPADTFGAVIPVLAELRGVPGPVITHGSVCTVEGEIPAARVHEFERSLPPLTRGEGVLDAEFARYEPVSGPPPVRRRSDANPLNRKEYLLRVMRNV